MTERAPTKAELQQRLEALETELAAYQRRLDEVETARDEHLNDLQRLAADFDNFRKRAARDQENLVARAHERLVKELLPVLDDLERALESAAEHQTDPNTHTRRELPRPDLHRGHPREAPAESKLEEGVRLVERELRRVLEREGLLEIETNGTFDPHVHEALLSQPSDAEEGTVIQVLQKGYRLGDRVIRPARVVIAARAQE